jgi:hypothetical protein
MTNVHYAVEETVRTLTKGLESTLGSTDIAGDLMDSAMNHSDITINNKLKKAGVPTNLEEDELTQAGNLFASVFLFDAFSSDNETRRQPAKAWEDQANEILNGFIEQYLENTHEITQTLPKFSSLI